MYFIALDVPTQLAAAAFNGFSRISSYDLSPSNVTNLTILSLRYGRNLNKSEYELANEMIKENKKLNYKQFKNSISKSKIRIKI